jgi:hypothetical protein
MRALAIAAVLAGCTPDIATAAYVCGDEESCPPGFVCNGLDNLCVTPAVFQEFACTADESHEPDDDIAHGFPIQTDTCASSVALHGCLAPGDSQNWISLTTPTGCSGVEIATRNVAPIAFEPLVVSITDGAGNVLASDAPCGDASPSNTNGLDTTCGKMTVQPGMAYGVRVAPAGGGDCNGDCAFNRYYVTITVDIP